MNAMTNITSYTGVDFETAQAEAAGPAIRDVFWGYYVPAATKASNPVARGGVGAAAVALMVCGILIWADGSTAIASDLVAMKIVVSGFFLICGGMLAIYAHEADRPEIQIDTARGELRFAVRSSRNRVKIWARSSFLNVCDVVVIDEGDTHSLQVEFVDGREVWEIATGTKDDLRPLMYRLNRDFSRGGLDRLVSRPDPKGL